MSVKPDRILYRGADLLIGEFRLHSSQRPFSDTGPIGGFLLVFPRAPVIIQHVDREPVVADATRVMLYNRGQEYRRRALTERGDVCEYFSYPPRLVAEALAAGDPSARDRLDRPFTATHAPSDAETYLLQRSVVEHVTQRARPIDPLFVEEAMMRLLSRCARASRTPFERERARTQRDATSRDHHDVADACRIVLAKHLGDALSLKTIAARVGVSPFHLARVFRRVTGATVHAHRNDLRLRAALDRVAAGEDLSRVALDVGFASHSHFTAAFRESFRTTPSRWRDDPSKILTA